MEEKAAHAAFEYLRSPQRIWMHRGRGEGERADDMAMHTLRELLNSQLSSARVVVVVLSPSFVVLSPRF